MAQAPRTPRLSTSPESDHAFYEIGSRRFEHLARALHEAQPGIFGANLYAPDGQEQFGIDHVAFHRSESGVHLEVGQAKAERRFGADAIRKAADKFLDNWDTQWRDKNVRRFILFVGCAIKSGKASDEIIAQTSRFAALGIEFAVWDSPAIYERLPGAPAAVRTYLGQDWYEKIFGKPSGPLSELVRDLETGWDLSALRVQAMVTRLNQAETAEIAELKRRAGRGEGARVVSELENALKSETASVLAAPVKAAKLRLLAALTMGPGNYARIRRLLDDADELDGDSARLRAILLMEAVGSAEVLEHIADDATAELAEVRAVALLREGRAREAFDAMARFAGEAEPRAETLRLAALASLVLGERTDAVALAERAVQRDPDSRACQQTLATCLFHRALSPTVKPEIGEWPQPIDQPLVMASDGAREDLEQAERLFRSLMASPHLDQHEMMVMWHFGVLACMPWRHADTLARLDDLQSTDALPIPVIAWAISRALPFDRVAAAVKCDSKLAADPGDFETLLIRVALANANGELKSARDLLEGHREALLEAGHGGLYSYWSAALDLEMRKSPADAVLAAHPWLRLRRAVNISSKKPRIRAIATVLKGELAAEGDARVILAATQLLLDAGSPKNAVRAASFLIDRVGTAEAITAAAIAYYRCARSKEVLAALASRDAFPAAELPVELERLRAECLAAMGSLLNARDASLAVARITGQPSDLWRSIELQLAIGAAPKALALYEEHAASLADPSPGHITLARAVLQSHPEIARRITRQIAADAPDDFVTAAFELANKLRMGAEQRALMTRIQELADVGKGGVEFVTLDDVIRMAKERREQGERALELYANGHSPVYFLSGLQPAFLSNLYLEPLIDVPAIGAARLPLYARYGRRLEEDAWPAERRDVRLIMDVTALLTAHGLGILDMVERAFSPIRIAPEAIAALLQVRSDVEIAQPERVEAARRVMQRRGAGTIQATSQPIEAGAMRVVWKGEDVLGAAHLSLARLVEALAETLDETVIQDACTELGELAKCPGVGMRPPDGSALVLEAGLAVSLEMAGLMSPLVARFGIRLDPFEADRLASEIAGADVCQRQVDSLSRLLQRLHDGLEDGHYQTVGYGTESGLDPLRRAFMQCLKALQEDGGIAWVDDRYTSSIDNAQFQIATTIEVLDALVRHDRLTDRECDALRQRLRAAGWLFMPQRGDEIVRHLRAATHKGEVTETPDLGLLRRAIGELLMHRRRLQWPAPGAVAEGIRGEVPFLLDTGHAVTQALVAIWRDDSWSLDDAEAASEWIIDILEIGLFPMQVLAAGDPRSDELLGVHLGSLVLVALQFFSGKDTSRQAAYLDWFWRHYLGNFLRIRPEIRPSLEAMIARHLEDDGVSGPEKKLWRGYLAQVLNAVPLALRASLLAREDVRQAFDLPDHGQISVGGEDYDEVEFFRAVINASVQTPVRLVSLAGNDTLVDLVAVDGGELVRFKVGSRQMRVDDWARRVSSDDPDVRKAAIEERDVVLDLSAAERADLNASIGEIPDRIARVRAVLSRTHETAQHDYSDLEQKVKEREAVGLWDFSPRDVRKIVRHLRLDAGIEDATERLLDERGLGLAIRRISALPINAPQVLRELASALDPAGLAALLDAAQIETATPWAQLFTAELVLSATSEEGLTDQARQLVEQALGPQNASLWPLYIAFAQFTASEGPGDPKWNGFTASQQLAACWSHSSSLIEILVAGGVIVPSLMEVLQSVRLVSPRSLVAQIHKFQHDVADPQRMTPDRLRIHSAAPALLRLRSLPGHREWAEARLRALMLETSEDGLLQPRLEISRGALAPDNALNSFFTAPLGEALKELHPGIAGLFCDYLPDMLSEMLRSQSGTDQRCAAWRLLRIAGGDAPLPEALSQKAREAAIDPDGRVGVIGRQDDGLQDSRFALLEFSALAAVNGWTELAEWIDAEAQRLGPQEDEDDVMVMFEVAVWRARLAALPAERTRAFAGSLLDLGMRPRLSKQAELAARHFARNLSGAETEPFVDTLGALYFRR